MMKKTIIFALCVTGFFLGCEAQTKSKKVAVAGLMAKDGFEGLVLDRKDVDVVVDYDTPLLDQVIKYDLKFLETAKRYKIFRNVEKLIPPQKGKFPRHIYLSNISLKSSVKSLSPERLIKFIHNEQMRGADIWEVMAIVNRNRAFLIGSSNVKTIIAPGTIWEANNGDTYVPAVQVIGQFNIGQVFTFYPWETTMGGYYGHCMNGTEFPYDVAFAMVLKE